MSRSSKKLSDKQTTALERKVLKFVVDSCLFELNEDDEFVDYLVRETILEVRSRLGFKPDDETTEDDDIKISVMATKLVGRSISQVNRVLRDLKTQRLK